MSLKMSSDEAEAPDTAIIPHPSKKTTSLPSLLPTEAYPPPVPGAVLRCYMRNSAPSGSIFCMMWTHVDAGVYSTTSRSGRTSTGLGNVTLKSFHSESEMNKFVFRQISERCSRPGAMAFVDHPVPASLPEQAKPSGKGTKRKVDANTTSSTTTTTTTTTPITPTNNANLPEDLFPMILSYIGDPGTLVALGRVSWDFNAIVEERVEAMPWAERFYFDHGRKPSITLPRDLRNLNEDWNEQDKVRHPSWGSTEQPRPSGSSGPPREPPGIDKVLVQIMYQEPPFPPEELAYYDDFGEIEDSFVDCRAIISPSDYEIAVAIEETFREISDTSVMTYGTQAGYLTYVDSYGHEGLGKLTPFNTESNPTSTNKMLQLSSSTSARTMSAQIHPVALFSILEAYTRRSEGSTRVIGTLLGKYVDSVATTDRSVVIEGAFAIPYYEKDGEIGIHKEYAEQMYNLQKRAHKNLRVVGWFSTTSNGEMIAESTAVIQSYYTQQCLDHDCLHLAVDTSLSTDNLSLSAYVLTPLVAAGRSLANMFHEIKLTTFSSDCERLFVDSLVRSNNVEGEPVDLANSEQDNMSSLESSMANLGEMLDRASKYVDDVVEGRIEGNNAIGRRIADAVGNVPRIRPEVFDKMFNDNLQDLLMVMYLSNLTKTQLTIAEKLQESLVV